MKIFILFLLLSPLKSFAANYVVITNLSNPLSSMTKQELSQILLANRVSWNDNERKITLILFAPNIDEGEEIFNLFMGMTGTQAKKYYLTKVFSGVLPSLPIMSESAEEIIDLVAKKTGSLSIVPDTTSTAKVKVLNIN